MNKKMVACVICYLSMAIPGGNLHAATAGEQAALQKHVEKMKLKSPGKYQEMAQRAGTNITGCLSCHVEVVGQVRKFGNINK